MAASKDKKDGDKLPVMECFYSIQGEGLHTGKAAYFIRLAGCNVGCHWCDVKDSWDKNKHAEIKISQLVKEAKNSGAPIVIITGGEPTMYPLGKLTGALKKEGLLVHLETSGAYHITGYFDWVCLSPKKRMIPLKESLEAADELKVVVYNKDDFKWAETNALTVNNKCKLFLQPEWSKASTVMPLITKYIKDNPAWRVSLQTHKYLNIP
ncbi:MAG TPA: 7-carboxy-7-deazaguanine synthase QueE [Bacteroidia bacterium]|nr:7-carboxy-7-deazaguanine synthase QueE [Bacteroidia bacterium]